MNGKHFLIFLIILMAGCSEQHTEGITPEKTKDTLFISAASSLTDVMTALIDIYKSKHPDVEITLNLGSSGKLAQQIQQGAPVDLYLSADSKWVEALKEENLILLETVVNFAQNEVVLIANKSIHSGIQHFSEINATKISQIAIGDPQSVPVGKYTEEALQSIGKWNEIKNHVVLASDARQVLTYVESGNTDYGFVYASDAKMSDKIKVLASAHHDSHSPIIYPAVIIRGSSQIEIANQFLQFIQSDEADSVFKKYGFKN